MKEDKYYVWSHEHQAYWVQSCFGYTKDIDKAGQFSRQKAEEILRQANVVKIEEEMRKVDGGRGPQLT